MTATTVQEKAERFRALHESGNIFVMPNPWDAGSARLLAGMGFPALATSSFAAAMVAGLWDGDLNRKAVLVHARSLAEATDLPVSADLENGFGTTLEEVAETYRLAAEAGLAGGSIEDYTGDAERPFYEIEEAADRVRAAVEAVRGLPHPFTLTARAENFFRGRNDLDDTIRRLQAYEEAGADVLFAPGLPDLAAVKSVCSSVSKPVNFLSGIPGKWFPLEELAEAGVRRVSVGGGMFKAALGGLLQAAGEIRERGSFSFLDHLPPNPTLRELLGH